MFNLTLTCDDGGTTASMVLTRHKQRQPPNTLYSIGSQRLADKLSRHLDIDDWKLDPVHFAELGARFSKHFFDRLTFALNTLLPR
jgi:hypothetical protein